MQVITRKEGSVAIEGEELEEAELFAYQGIKTRRSEEDFQAPD